MLFFYILALWAPFFTAVSAHMTLASPVPFGDPTTSPLSSDGSNFPCQITGDAATFYSSTSASANNTMAIGATQTLSFHGSAVHGGGSCQLALTTDLAPTSSSVWQVILSIEGGCPTTDGTGPSTYDYTIPSSIAAGKYVFAWTWISKLSGAPEYYMNCAPVTITGSSSKREAGADIETETAAIEERDTSALPNLFVANLASINSCKSTTSTDVVYPDPGPNVSKPSKMTTNFQSPAGTNCFPLGGTSSGGSSSGSSSSAAASAPASSAATSAATGAATSSPAAATTATAVTSAAAQSSGGVFVTVSTPAAGTTSAAATSAAATTTPTVSTTAIATPSVGTTSAAPATTSSAGNGTSTGGSTGGSGLSGACTNEGVFNCVGGSQYQQCASGTWTALRPMPAGTTCQTGESNTLWARGAARVRRIRRAL